MLLRHVDIPVSQLVRQLAPTVSKNPAVMTTRTHNANEDNFSQVTTFWSKVLSEAERSRLVNNIAGHLKDAKEFIQKRAVHNFSRVSPEFGRRLTEALAKYHTSKGVSAPASL